MSKKQDTNQSRNLPEEGTGKIATADYFAERRGRADFGAFDKIMSRKRGEEARGGDEV
jgi:hypothetical protein